MSLFNARRDAGSWMDTTEDPLTGVEHKRSVVSKRRRLEEIKRLNEESTKRARKEREEKDKEDERRRRLLLQSGQPEFRQTAYYETLGPLYPRIVAINGNYEVEDEGMSPYTPAVWKAIARSAWRDFGLPLHCNSDLDEFGHSIWGPGRIQRTSQQSLMEFGGMTAPLSEEGVGRIFVAQWFKLKASSETGAVAGERIAESQFNLFLKGFDDPVVAITGRRRSIPVAASFKSNRTTNKLVAGRNIAPASLFDVIRDTPRVVSMSIILVYGESWEIDDDAIRQIAHGTLNELGVPLTINDFESASAESIAEKKQFIEDALSRPPDPHYILELVDRDGLPTNARDEGPKFIKNTVHFRLFVSDLIARYPKLRAMATTRNSLGGIAEDARINIDACLKSAIARRDKWLPKCTLSPPDELKLNWPWTPPENKTMQTWPVEMSVFDNHAIGELKTMFIPSIIQRIQQFLQFVLSEKRLAIPNLKFHFRHFGGTKEEEEDEEKSTESLDRLPFSAVARMSDYNFSVRGVETQGMVEGYAQYMHFPAGNSQFHVAFEFGFEYGVGDQSHSANHYLNLTDKFHPEILVPPNPQVAFYRKLEKQGQLLLIRCLPQLRGPNEYKLLDSNVNTIYYTPDGDIAANLGLSALMLIYYRIVKAQEQQVVTTMTLNRISQLRPKQALPGDVNLLIKSFLAGKYDCHNPGCTNKTTMACGHCDDAGYCSDQCSGKHWPVHSTATPSRAMGR